MEPVSSLYLFIIFSPISDYDKYVQMANVSLAHLAQSKPLTWVQRLSCSENALFVPGLEDAAGSLGHTSLENFSTDTSKGPGVQGLRGRWVCHVCSLGPDHHVLGAPEQSIADGII